MNPIRRKITATAAARRVFVAAFVLALFPVLASAQWLRLPLPNTPRTPDGQPNLTAPAPRTADGKPDLSGIWRTTDTGNFAEKTAVPMRPWAEALYKERQANNAKDNPEGLCLPPGIPEQMVNPLPWKIVQTPGLTLILFEQWIDYRQIFTDGRGLPKIDKPSWFGYSVGRWEGDTFVVETIGFNDKTWIGDAGYPHTEAMRVTERFRRLNFGSMEVEFTFDDPEAFTKPWSEVAKFRLLPDTETMEQVCENEKDSPHMVGR